MFKLCKIITHSNYWIVKMVQVLDLQNQNIRINEKNRKLFGKMMENLPKTKVGLNCDVDATG